MFGPIKAALCLVPVVLVLFTAAWVLIYYAFPDYPPRRQGNGTDRDLFHHRRAYGA